MKLPNAKQIEVVLRYLPTFQKPDADLFKTHPGREEGNQITLPWVESSGEMDRFMHNLFENDFIQPFDWGEWQSEAVRYVQTPAWLEQADLETLVKLLTLHIRKERFAEGHFAEMVECRHIQKILERLQEIQRAGKGS